MFRVTVLGLGISASLFFTACQPQPDTATENADLVGSEAPAKEPNSSQAAAERVRVVTVPNGGIVPDAEVDSRGVIHLTYFANNDVWYTSSSDDGQTFRDPIRVNTEEGFAYGGAFRGPDLAIGKDDRVHIAWYNSAYQQKRPQEEWGVMYSRLLPNKDRFETARNLNHKPSDNFSIAADEKGNVSVIWMAGGVFATCSDDGGDSFSEAKDLQTDPCECCSSRAMFANGTLSVLYRDKAGKDRDIYLASLSDNGQRFEHTKVSQTPWYIDSCPMTGSFISPAADGIVAAWETKGEIYYARMEPSGKLTSAGEILASDQGRYPVTLTAADGVTVVAWKNSEKLEWQLFDSQDNPTEQRGSKTGTTVDRPAGVVTSDGSFVLFL
ncbi:MAG: hypothetical protein KDB27_01120 [Planctomycetales bacterium]|nr:hypothetical protein [Planctomycetales bacterium]